MIPQVIKRQIGKVNIIDMKGSFTGVWASRLKGQLEHVVNTQEVPMVLNFRQISDLDTLALKTFFDATSRKNQIDILSGSAEIMNLFYRYPESKRFRILNNEQDLVSVYGQDLLQDSSSNDKRGGFRLQTALSIHFSYHEAGEKRQCVGIITNLSEHGFLVEYIDVVSVVQSLTNLNPFDIEEIDFRISLPQGKTVSGQGKVVHRQLNDEQFGMGVRIVTFNRQDEGLFSHFLQSQNEVLVHNRKAGK